MEKVRAHFRVKQCGEWSKSRVTGVVHSRVAKVQQYVDDMPEVTRDMLPLLQRSE